MNVLESSILKQKFALSSNLLELKEKEEKRKHICHCKGYCKIQHIFYNWSKPKSDEILTKAKIVLDNQVDVEEVEEGVFEKECYQCEHCDSNFVNSGDLKKYSEEKHQMKILLLKSMGSSIF